MNTRTNQSQPDQPLVLFAVTQKHDPDPQQEATRFLFTELLRSTIKNLDAEVIRTVSHRQGDNIIFGVLARLPEISSLLTPALTKIFSIISLQIYLFMLTQENSGTSIFTLRSTFPILVAEADLDKILATPQSSGTGLGLGLTSFQKQWEGRLSSEIAMCLHQKRKKAMDERISELLEIQASNQKVQNQIFDSDGSVCVVVRYSVQILSQNVFMDRRENDLPSFRDRFRNRFYNKTIDTEYQAFEFLRQNLKPNDCIFELKNVSRPAGVEDGLTRFYFIFKFYECDNLHIFNQKYAFYLETFRIFLNANFPNFITGKVLENFKIVSLTVAQEAQTSGWQDNFD